MGHNMKYPKGKGFPFKDSGSPFEDTRFNRWGKEAGHAHNEDGTIDWENNNDQFYYTIEEDPETGEEIGTSTDYSGTPEDEMTNVDDNMTGRIETGIDWGESAAGGNSGQLIEPSLDPDAESVLTQQSREREQSGAHRYARGGQTQNPSTPVYPWGDNDSGGGETVDDIVKPNPNNTDTFGDVVSPVRDPKPNIDSFGDVVSSIDDSPNVDSFGDPASPANSYIDKPGRPNTSPANNRPKPTSPPNTSPVDSGPNLQRPNVSPVRPTATDIFGNVVSPIDGRGTQVPFSTVTTPGKFSLGRKGKPTKGNRSFRKK